LSETLFIIGLPSQVSTYDLLLDGHIEIFLSGGGMNSMKKFNLFKITHHDLLFYNF